MRKIKKGDEVVVLAGKDKGRRGTVARIVDAERLVVGGVNIAKKHQKGDPNAGVPGGIVDKEMPLHVSNVALWNVDKDDGKGGADRVGFRTIGEGDGRRKVRYFKSTQELVDR